MPPFSGAGSSPRYWHAFGVRLRAHGSRSGRGHLWKEKIQMPELLEPKARQAEEALRESPVAAGEAVLEPPRLERSKTRKASSAASPARALASAEVIEAAHRVAQDIYGCWEFPERLEVYKSVGDRFKADARRILDAAAARWPELIVWVNDMPEWKALLFADLS